MKSSILAFASVLLAVGAVAQNCGPQYANKICAAGKCCSQYGWCDTTAAHCNPANCLKAFSGTGSTCKGTTTTNNTPPTTTTPPSGGSGAYASTVPVIDVCGSASGGVSCPGAGAGGYFYRCCSSGGHCGPKNTEQGQQGYCGAGCQPGFGDCSTNKAVPPPPAAPAGTAAASGTCGPIVNLKCPKGQCCSGSNFCGTGVDYCGAANWCQTAWGECQR